MRNAVFVALLAMLIRGVAIGQTAKTAPADALDHEQIGKLLKDMGYEKVFNLGGLKDWVEAGGEVE